MELKTMPIAVEQISEIIIEEVSKGHKLLHRHKLSQNKIEIGRDYHNDIILTDSHVCPSHLTIELLNGQWQITDNQTVNGTTVEQAQQKKKNADQHIINDGDVINLGKSQLLIRFSDHNVEPTIAFSPFDNIIDVLRHPMVLCLSIALFAVLAGGIFYLNSPKEVNFTQFLVSSIKMVLGFAFWPAGVALVAHLSKQEARIMAQLGVSFAFFNLMWLSDFLESITNYNSASNSMLPIVVMMISIVLAYSLFWLNAYIGFQMSAKRRTIVAASITALLFGGGALVQFSNKPEFNPRPQYNATLMMPSFLLTSSSSVDQFIEDTSKLFDKASEKAREQ